MTDNHLTGASAFALCYGTAVRFRRARAHPVASRAANPPAPEQQKQQGEKGGTAVRDGEGGEKKKQKRFYHPRRQ